MKVSNFTQYNQVNQKPVKQQKASFGNNEGHFNPVPAVLLGTTILGLAGAPVVLDRIRDIRTDRAMQAVPEIVNSKNGINEGTAFPFPAFHRTGSVNASAAELLISANQPRGETLIEKNVRKSFCPESDATVVLSDEVIPIISGEEYSVQASCIGPSRRLQIPVQHPPERHTSPFLEVPRPANPRTSRGEVLEIGEFFDRINHDYCDGKGIASLEGGTSKGTVKVNCNQSTDDSAEPRISSAEDFLSTINKNYCADKGIRGLFGGNPDHNIKVNCKH